MAGSLIGSTAASASTDLAGPRQLLLDIGGNGCRAAVDADCRLTRCLRPVAARREIEAHSAETLRYNLVSGLKSNVEIRQNHLTGGSRITTRRNHFEAQGRDDVVACLVAGCMQVGDRRGDVDRVSGRRCSTD